MKKFLAVFAVIALVAFAAPAFAANPFMDVPAGHWAYDAVAQLAARGVVSGYPDGAFKGAQPATRYEVASVVARALAKIDAEKASKQDLEMLKKLVMEFKDELDALGVKVDKLDKRVAVLEDRLGGWKLNGSFQFDANFSGDGMYNENGADTEFHKEFFALVFQKQIDETTSFYARMRGGQYITGGTGRGDINAGEFHFDRIYVDMKLPYDVDFRVGRWLQDFEGDMGLYWGYDANPMFGSDRMDGFRAHKAWGNFNGTAIVARNSVAWDYSEWDEVEEKWVEDVLDTDVDEYMHYVLDMNFRPNEKFWVGATAYWWQGDFRRADAVDANVNTYGIYAGFAFNPNVELKGIYYFQNIGNDLARGFDDSPKAWKAVLDVKQDLLKFTSLWLQYEQVDNSFYGLNPQNNMDWGRAISVTDNMLMNDNSTKIWMIGAEQVWNDKWTTFLKYAQADYDTPGLDDAKNWTAGVTYQYTPAVAFQLVYDNIDFGDNNPDGLRSGDDHLIKFRTSVSF